MELVVENNADLRRENLPVADEIAVLIPNEYEEKYFCNIVLVDRGGNEHPSGLRAVDPFNAAYLPLAYPLLFPRTDWISLGIGMGWGT